MGLEGNLLHTAMIRRRQIKITTAQSFCHYLLCGLLPVIIQVLRRVESIPAVNTPIRVSIFFIFSHSKNRLDSTFTRSIDAL